MPRAETRVKLPGHAAFARLRLADFFPELKVVEARPRDPGAAKRFSGKVILFVDNWEHDGHVNVGELLGFTEFLRLRSDPERTRSIALALTELPAGKVAAMLSALGLPLRKGMGEAALCARLGTPRKRFQFVADREQLEFATSAPGYRVRCTVKKRGGLVYVVVTRAR